MSIEVKDMRKGLVLAIEQAEVVEGISTDNEVELLQNELSIRENDEALETHSSELNDLNENTDLAIEAYYELKNIREVLPNESNQIAMIAIESICRKAGVYYMNGLSIESIDMSNKKLSTEVIDYVIDKILGVISSVIKGIINIFSKMLSGVFENLEGFQKKLEQLSKENDAKSDNSTMLHKESGVTDVVSQIYTVSKIDGTFTPKMIFDNTNLVYETYQKVSSKAIKDIDDSSFLKKPNDRNKKMTTAGYLLEDFTDMLNATKNVSCLRAADKGDYVADIFFPVHGVSCGYLSTHFSSKKEVTYVYTSPVATIFHLTIDPVGKYMKPGVWSTPKCPFMNKKEIKQYIEHVLSELKKFKNDQIFKDQIKKDLDRIGESSKKALLESMDAPDDVYYPAADIRIQTVALINGHAKILKKLFELRYKSFKTQIAWIEANIKNLKN